MMSGRRTAPQARDPGAPATPSRREAAAAAAAAAAHRAEDRGHPVLRRLRELGESVRRQLGARRRRGTDLHGR